MHRNFNLKYSTLTQRTIYRCKTEKENTATEKYIFNTRNNKKNVKCLDVAFQVNTTPQVAFLLPPPHISGIRQLTGFGTRFV